MNRQIGVADCKYGVLYEPIPPGHVTRRMRMANFAFKMTRLHCFQQWIKLEAKQLAVSMLRWISTQIQGFRFKMGVASGHGPNSKFWDQYNF